MSCYTISCHMYFINHSLHEEPRIGYCSFCKNGDYAAALRNPLLDKIFVEILTPDYLQFAPCLSRSWQHPTAFW